MENTIDLQFVEYIVKSLVGKPESVSINRTIDEKGVLLELTVDPEDLGRVIGKRGATAQSLRTLLRALGTKNEARYNLKIIDNGEPRPEREGQEQRRDDRHEHHNDRRDFSENSKKSDDNSSEIKDYSASSTRQHAEPKTSSLEDAWGSPSAPVQKQSSAEDDRFDAISKARKDLADFDDLDI